MCIPNAACVRCMRTTKWESANLQRYGGGEGGKGQGTENHARASLEGGKGKCRGHATRGQFSPSLHLRAELSASLSI
jgi:hypothetical protein